MEVGIRPLTKGDWPEISRIYREGIETGDATFETAVPSWDSWHESRHPAGRIVAERAGTVVGFAAVSPVSRRAVYRGVAEVMVYVAAHARGEGVGRRLMEALVEATEAAGIWTLQAGIFSENEASVALHRAVGFRVVGTQERLGRTAAGRWRDVVVLERRSARVGTD